MTPPRPVNLLQTIIDSREPEVFRPIPTQTIQEENLVKSDLFQIFDHVFPLGLSPGFSETGRLVALAIADAKECRIIEFVVPRIDKTTKTEKSVPEDVLAIRKELQEKILCRPIGDLLAFDMAPLAMAIHKYLHLRVTNAIDIQSCFSAIDRQPISAIEEALGDSVKINRENVRNVFLYPVYGEDDTNRTTDLAMRAWVSQFLATFKDGMMLFENSKRIDTKKLTESVIGMVSKVATDSVRLDQKKPLLQTHSISPSIVSATPSDGFQLHSTDYSTRLRRNDKVYNVTAATDSGSITFSGTVGAASGSSAHINATHSVSLSGRMVMQVTSIGRDNPTTAEAKRAAVVLRVLQGELHLLHNRDNPWIKNIWFNTEPDTPLVWPVAWSANQPQSPRATTKSSSRTLNPSQRRAVNTMLSDTDNNRFAIIQGPPGTGKTSVISSFVHLSIQLGRKGIWLVAESNVAVKNIAERLLKDGFLNWKLLVSKDFRHDWHEHLYVDLKSHIIQSNQFNKTRKSDLEDTQIILCTLSMLSNDLIAKKFTPVIPLHTLVVDEASQIEIGQYIPVFTGYSTLRKVCFIGDDKQLPPHGQEDLKDLQSIFEIAHLRQQILFLDTQYRMPPQIGDIISEAVYEGKLKSNDKHPITSEVTACYFVNIANGTERQSGTSFMNDLECQAILKLARKLEASGKSYRIITPYIAQTNHIEDSLKQAGLDWGNKCFNVDSFQGNEDDYILISVVRSRSTGFLNNFRRTNVMLTRCKAGMFIFSSQKFLAGPGAETLVGTVLKKMGNSWISDSVIEEMDL